LPCSIKDIPPWVKRCPIDEKGEYIYAVGYSSSAFYHKDTIEHAKDHSRIELAKSIKIDVKEEMFDIMVSEKRSFVRKNKFITISETITDSILTDSEILEIWHDRNGVTGEKKILYMPWQELNEIL